jgi:indole-3-glycerol phosphate synthase
MACLERRPHFSSQTVSLAETLKKKEASGIIAEFKRRSPAKGIINGQAKVVEVTCGYAEAGASALSILTDNHFFGGSNEDLVKAREKSSCPILRKEFIVDPYQIFEAKSLGADAILLIAAILTPGETLAFARLARSLGLETILEVHGPDELAHLNDQISILGVNNRNLKDFTVSLDVSLSLAGSIPDGIVAISESGIHHPTDLSVLKQAGYRGFLIGELFMSSSDPAESCRTFISQSNQAI